MLFSTRCGACDAIGPSPCDACRVAMERCPPSPVPGGLDGCPVLLRYEGPARELVARIKYRNHRASLPWLADQLAALVAGDDLDVVTWAPTTAPRRRSRGFDHAELLARRVARHLGVPCRTLVRRAPGPPQTGRDREARRLGPCFVPIRDVSAASVLLVDDVVTTGATLTAAAVALRAAGAGRVIGLAVAHPARR